MERDSAITLYNKYKVGTKEMYAKTIIKNATWRGGIESTVTTDQSSKGQVNMAKDIKIRIPIYNNDFGGKTYIEEKAWAKLSESDKLNNYFTMQEGDRVVKGECAYTYSPTTLITDLNNIDDVISIMAYKVNNYGSKILQHFLIGGK